MDKLVFQALAMGLLVSGSLAVAAKPEWNNLEVLQLNREAPRATMMVYPDAQSALKYDRTTSPWFESLNGEWKFNWVRSPKDRPQDFHKLSFDVSTGAPFRFRPTGRWKGTG